MRPYENITAEGLREGFIRADKSGNELTPQQRIKEGYFTDFIRVSGGFDDNFYEINLPQGEHILKLTSVNETLKFKSIELTDATPLQAYTKPTSVEGGEVITLQAEGATLKSDSMILPYSDRSSVLTKPQDATLIKLNIIGGSNWSTPGQWLEWSFDVPKTGSYSFSLRYKQKFLSGSFVSRRIYIDDKIPFSALNSIRFDYNDNWQIKTLGQEEPFLFNLEKGQHTIRIEATIGEMKALFNKASDLA